MPESPREELSRRLEGYPTDALSYFKGGFRTISELSEETRRRILDVLIKNFKKGSVKVDNRELSEITELPIQESGQVGAAYTIVIGLLSESNATPDDFVQAASGILFRSEDDTVALSMAQTICAQRLELKSSVERTQLTNRVLPSLYAFDVAIDLRVSVVDGNIVAAAPVAVVHLDTDTDNCEIWLQLSSADVESLIKTLSRAIEDMKVADDLFARKS